MNSLPNIHGFHSRNEGYSLSNNQSGHPSTSYVPSNDGALFNCNPWPNMFDQHRESTPNTTSQPRTALGLREPDIRRNKFCNNFFEPFSVVRENNTASSQKYNLSPDMEFDDTVIYSQPYRKVDEVNKNISNQIKNSHIKVPFIVKNGLNFKEKKPRTSQKEGFKTNTTLPCLKSIDYSNRMEISSKMEPSDQTFVFKSSNTVPKYKRTLESFKSLPSRKHNTQKSSAKKTFSDKKEIAHLNLQYSHRKGTLDEAIPGKVHENSLLSTVCQEKGNLDINDVFDEPFVKPSTILHKECERLIEKRPNEQEVKINVIKDTTTEEFTFTTHLAEHSQVFRNNIDKTSDLKNDSNHKEGVCINNFSGNNASFIQQSKLSESFFVKTEENEVVNNFYDSMNKIVDKNQLKTTCQQNENKISDLSQNIFVRTQESVVLKSEFNENMVSKISEKNLSEELSLPPYQKPVEYESPDFDVDDLFSLKDEHIRDSLSTFKEKRVNIESEKFLKYGNDKDLSSNSNGGDYNNQVNLKTFEEEKHLSKNRSSMKKKIERDISLNKNESEKISIVHPVKSKYFQTSVEKENPISEIWEIPKNDNKLNKNGGKVRNKDLFVKNGDIEMLTNMDVEVNIDDIENSDSKPLTKVKSLKQSTLFDCRSFQPELKRNFSNPEQNPTETPGNEERFKKPLPPSKKAKTTKTRSLNKTGEISSPVPNNLSHLTNKSKNVFLQSNTSMRDIKQKCDPSKLVQSNLFQKELVNRSVSSKTQQKRNTKPSFVPPLAASHLTSQETALKNYTVTVIDEVSSDQVLQRMDSEELTKVVTTVAFKEGYTLLNKPGDQKKNSRCFPSGVMFMIVWGTGRFGFYWLPLLDHSSITPSVTKLVDRLMSKSERNICFEAQAVYMLLMDVLNHKDISNWNAFDPLIGSWLLDPDNPPKDFQETSEKLQMDRNLLVVNPQANTKNQACDLLQVLDAAMNLLQNRLVNASLWTVFSDMETKLIPILAAMESSSILVDVDKLHQTADVMDKKLRKLQSDAHNLADRWFQLNSPQQLREILFDQLKLDEKFNLKIKKTDQGVKSTSETVLEQIKEYHPLPKIVLEYRRLQKLKSTYVDGLLQHVKTDGTIGTSWEQVSAATGRITSKNPNLQAVPKSPIIVQDGEAIRLREMFKARDGCSFLAADFQQIEFRVFAHFTQDKSLLQAFREGGDIFQRLAERWLGGKTEEEREKTKRIVYSVMYGAGANKLSEYLHVEPSEAYKIINNFIAIFPSLRSLPKTVIAQCRAQGFVATLSGRRRLFPHIRSTNGKLRSYSERQAMNFLIQGSAADICKAAMLDCEAEIRSRGLRAKLLMMIHDELIWEVDDRDLAETSRTVREAMEHRWNDRLTLLVPIPVCVSKGKTLANMESLEEHEQS